MKKRLITMVASIFVLIALLVPGAMAQTAKVPSGSLVLYTGNGTEITDPLLAGFKQAYPGIKVEIIKGGSGDLLARIKAEKGNPGGDVLWGGEPLMYDTEASLFQPWASPSDKAMIRQDPKNIWHLWSFMAQSIFVNTSLIKNPSDWPKSIKELADPKWQKYGKIALADPNKSGTGATLVDGFYSLYGWKFVQDLLKNCEVSPGSDAMFSAVKDGADPIGFMNEDLGAKWEQMGLPVKMIFPTDGITNTLDASGIIAGAKNLENARVFIDWLGSKDSHQILRTQVLRRSCRTDMTPPPGLIDLSQYKLVPMANLTRDEIKANFNDQLEKARANN